MWAGSYVSCLAYARCQYPLLGSSFLSVWDDSVSGGEYHDCRTSIAYLSKSRVTTGLHCHKLLWWKVHDRAGWRACAPSSSGGRECAGIRMRIRIRRRRPSRSN